MRFGSGCLPYVHLGCLPSSIQPLGQTSLIIDRDDGASEGDREKGGGRATTVAGCEGAPFPGDDRT